ncbi:MAG: urea ABC transporter permease subunit UrtB [Granulosicoccus sp.]|nr:urea ABC transporter permease subunit UrtB [Granulosicoccus sp.]
MIAGKLYVVKKSKRVVIAEKKGKLLSIRSASDDELLGEVKKRSLRKVSLDNAMRKQVRNIVSSMALQHPDRQKRLDAINGLLAASDRDTVDRVRELLDSEEDEEVRSSMRLLLSVSDLEHGTQEQQQAALEFVDGNLDIRVLNTLRDVASQSENKEIAAIAGTFLRKAEKKREYYAHVETLFFGLSLGSVLVVAAIGLAITFGVMGVINMAHGELIMLGAYTTYFIQQLMPEAITYSLIVAVPAAFIVSGLMGILIERGVIRHLYGRPLETLLATFGISLILQQLVRTTVSSQNVAVINPIWMSGSWVINPALSLTLNRVVIIFFCLAVFAALLLLFTRSGFGLQMRAVAQNRQMARAMGIRSARVDALTFGLGSGVAGIAGVALSQLGNVGPNLGQNYIIDSFMVVVFGGVGSLWGTLVAGMSLGVANKILEPWAGAVLAKICLLVFIILFIQKRPRGLFPQRGRAAES